MTQKKSTLPYKMVISDFDDTLLSRTHEISQHTIDTIHEYIDAGGLFTISTGRMGKSIEKWLPRLGLGDISIPLMSFQGALVVDSLSGETLLTRDMSYEQALLIVNFAYNNGEHVQIYSGGELIVDQDNEQVRTYCSKTEVEFTAVGDLRVYLQKTKCSCHKVLIMESEQNMVATLAKLSEIVGDSLIFNISYPTLLEVVSPLAGKGNTMVHMAGVLGIDVSEILAIGDSMNDISMVKIAGLGLAVANARDDLKQVAKAIVPSCDEDGVAYAINKYCLGKTN